MLALLDLDGTLVDRDAGFRSWCSAFAARYHIDEPGCEWVRAWDREAKERGRFFTGLIEHFGLNADRDMLWAEYRAVMPQVTPAFAGVASGLTALRQRGWRLVLLSNGRMDNQLGKLRRTGLLELLDACHISEQTGLRKPDPRAFLAAVGAEAEDVWMVGDDPTLDVLGAGRAGLPAVWISHGRPWPGDLPQPAVTVATPAEALRHLLVIVTP